MRCYVINHNIFFCYFVLCLSTGMAEILAMEMKSAGMYVSRGLSYKQAEVRLLTLFISYKQAEVRLLTLFILFISRRLRRLNCLLLFKLSLLLSG